MDKNSLKNDLTEIERLEENFLKTQKLLREIKILISNEANISEYQNDLVKFQSLLDALRPIHGWKPKRMSINPNVEEIAELEKQLAIYERELKQQKREFVKLHLIKLIKLVDNDLRLLAKEAKNEDSMKRVISPYFDELKDHISQITSFLGIVGWSDLSRHLRFGQVQDLRNIIQSDWPIAKAELEKSLYSEKEPVPIDIDDLALFVNSKPEINFEPLIQEDIPSKDSKVIDRMNSAISSYRRPGATLDSQRQAVRDLADVLEHLRPKIKSHLTSNGGSGITSVIGQHIGEVAEQGKRIG